MLTVIILLVLICLLLGFNLFKAHRKIGRYKLRIINHTNMLSRFSEIYWFDGEFHFLTKPFKDYVFNGKNTIQDVRAKVRENYEIEKQKIVANSLEKK